MEKQCSNCKSFCCRRPDSPQGQCRRHAPKPGDGEHRWPEVLETEWCHEFEPAPPTQGPTE